MALCPIKTFVFFVRKDVDDDDDNNNNNNNGYDSLYEITYRCQ
jgi:hypothetical protein